MPKFRLLTAASASTKVSMAGFTHKDILFFLFSLFFLLMYVFFFFFFFFFFLFIVINP